MTVRGRIRFFPPHEGGRHSAPNLIYSTLAKFIVQPHGGGDWSVVVRFDTPASLGVETPATFGFLSDQAPPGLLQPGATFWLYEGPKCVALATVDW